METRLEALAGFVLDGMVGRSLSDATVYEFTEQSSVCVHGGMQLYWGENLEKLWDYLADGYAAEECMEQDVHASFQRGRVYAALELLQMLQQQKKDEETLEDDAKVYGQHWRPVFEALKDGSSMTHGALAEMCNLSNSSLSQFLRRIKDKHYIQFRKAGRTKYYRLTGRGKKLLDHMPQKEKICIYQGPYKSIEKDFEQWQATGHGNYLMNGVYGGMIAVEGKDIFAIGYITPRAAGRRAVSFSKSKEFANRV